MNHPLIKGSTIILIGSFLGNILNFLFNLFMSRNLSISEYGILASLISLISLFGFPAGSIVPTIVNFAAIYFAKGELDNVRSFYFKVSKLFLGMGIVILIIFIVFTNQIGDFFNIHNNFLIFLAGMNIFVGFITVANIPLLQAKLLFKFSTISNMFGALMKLILGVTLVFLGFAVGGAMWAYLISSLFPYALSFIPLRFLLAAGKKSPKIELKKLFSYGVPASLALFGLSSFITSDIILVKHFFTPTNAGMYAGLSLIGRVIYFISAPIGTVMFPLAVQRHVKKEKYLNLLILSLSVVLLPSLVLIIGYFLFPDLVIRIFLKKDEYLAIAPLIGFFGIFIAIFSLLTITTNFYLSIKKTKVFIPIVVGALAQVLFISLYHNSFFQVILISTVISFLLLMILLIYYFIFCEKQSRNKLLEIKLD